MTFASRRGARIDPPFTEADWVKAGCGRVEIAASDAIDPPFDWGAITDENGEILSPEDFQLLKTWWAPEFYTGGTYLGLNAMRCFRYETTVAGFAGGSASKKYGSLSAILDDVSEVGAQFTRQNDFADLVWPRNTAPDPAPPVPYVPVRESDISHILEVGLLALTDMFVQMETRHQKPVLTFLSVGMGSYIQQQRAWSGTAPRDPLGQLDVGLVWLPFDLSQHSGPDPLHGSSIEDFLFNGVTTTVVRDTMTDPWLFSTLDPRSPYKLAFVEIIAKRAALLLQAVPYGTSSRLLAIELFNEVDHKNGFSGAGGASLTDIAIGWALLVHAAVRGFTGVFGKTAELCPIRFWLPSFTSHNPPFTFDTIATSTFCSTMAFHQMFLAELATLLQADGIDQKLFTNQDYHFYHFKDANGGGDAIPISRLRDELDALRSNCTVASGWGHLTISVCESGASLPVGSRVGYPLAIDKIATGYKYALRALNARDLATLERFQAREVWRRIAGAIASGAAYAGWNTMIATSGRSADFAGCGLRTDTGRDEETPSFAAHKRLSWWAYQQVHELLLPTHPRAGLRGGGGVGEFLAPVATSHRIYDIATEQTLTSAYAVDHLVILLFTSGSKGAYTYVIFLDPTAQDGSFVDVVLGHHYAAAGVIVTVYPSVPIRTVDRVTVGLGADGAGPILITPGALPEDSADWDPIDEWVLDPTHTLRVDVDHDPWVVVSNTPLTFVDLLGNPLVSVPKPAARLRKLRTLRRASGEE